MKTPFDDVIQEIRERGYHNHRLEAHSDIVSDGLFRDLLKECEPFGEDFQAGVVGKWSNVPAPGARKRKIDLLIAGHSEGSSEPDLEQTRLCLENKSVMTAHRNKDARFDDLNEALQVLYRVKPEAILIATVLIGLSERVLNVPDKIRPAYKGKKEEFRAVTRRLSTGDQSLWTEFESAIGVNRPGDPRKTVEKFRALPRRPPGQTHVMGYDYILLVPVRIDNVNPPLVARENPLGIDVDQGYQEMLETICKAYRVRWNL